MKVFDGTTWQVASLPAGTNATTFVGPEAPPGPLKIGDLWYDTDDVPAPVITLPVSIVNGGTGVSTAAAARTSLAMPGEELAYNQITASATTTAGSAAAATLAIEGTSRTYDGTPIIVEFWSGLLYSPAVVGSWVVVNLWDDVTDLGQFGQVGGGSANGIGAPVFSRRRIVPTVGTHNYRIKAWISTSGGGTGTVAAGTGGTYLPAFIRVTRA